MAETDDVDDLVEVYFATQEMEANRAILEVLGDLISFRRDRTLHALPAPASETGGYYIAVEAQHANEARERLREGLRDRILDGKSGKVLEPA